MLPNDKSSQKEARIIICGARKKDGAPCTRLATKGEEYCWQHSPKFWGKFRRITIVLGSIATAIILYTAVIKNVYDINRIFFPSATSTPTPTPTQTPTAIFTSISVPLPASNYLYFMFVLDASETMNETVNGTRRWDIALKSINTILESLPANANYGLVVVGNSDSDEVTNPCDVPSSVTMPFTQSKAKIFEKINTLKPVGNGSFSAAFSLASTQLEDLPRETVKYLIFVASPHDTCENNDEWKEIEIRMKFSSQIHIYSEVIVLDEEGVKQQSISEILEIIATNIPLPATPIYTPTVPVFTHMKNPNISEPDALGKVEYTYPKSILPGNNELVSLRISALDGAIDIKPKQAIQVTPASELDNCDKNIGVTDNMRAELTSPSFVIHSDDPILQKINLFDPNSTTTWEWIILPKSEGSLIVSLKLYFDDDVVSSWKCNMHIYVGSSTVTPSLSPTTTPTFTATATQIPSPTSTSTLTPTPTLTILEDAKKDFRGNLNDWMIYVLGSLGPLLAGLFGMIKKHLNRKDMIVLKKNALNGTKGKEKKLLEDEIARLESIKWWQFWR